MRALFWLNIVALSLQCWLTGWDVYGQTYGWWIGSDSGGYGLAHSPVVLLLLAIPLLALGALLANIRAIFSSSARPRAKVFYGLSSTILILCLLAFVWLPKDTLSSLTVELLGPGKRGSVLLYNSAATGRTKTVRTLLAAGAQLPRNESLTYVGATFGQLEIIKMGMARGDDINAVGYRTYTPLRSAIVNRQVAAVEFLLANGALSTDADKDGISALIGNRPRQQ